MVTDKSLIKDSRDIKDKERRASYVLLKTEKITAALYVVTNYLPDNEPVKWQLRRQALDLLNDVSYTSQTSPREFFVPDKILSVIDQIVSLIQIAMLNRDVSEMNFTLLRQEYLLLKKFIESGNEPKILTEARLASAPALSRVPLDNASSAPKAPLAKPTSGPTVPVTAQTLPRAPLANSSAGAEKVASTGADRSTQILGFLRKNGWSSLADVAQVLPGVSSKTVQRELSTLVDKGVVKRQGERRWSRYAVEG